MIDAILSTLGQPSEPFGWSDALFVLIALLLMAAYLFLEFALGLGLRKVWRAIVGSDDRK